eukprot:760267-Hanusia_phi.AAC.13
MKECRGGGRGRVWRVSSCDMSCLPASRSPLSICFSSSLQLSRGFRLGGVYGDHAGGETTAVARSPCSSLSGGRKRQPATTKENVS